MHENHRQRLKEKVIKDSNILADHELLEALLFSSMKQKDMNPLAHRLINHFGSLDNVFRANFNELMFIEEVGKETAVMILCIGKIYKRLNEPKKKIKLDINLKSTIEYSKILFSEAIVEQLCIVFLDAKNNVIFEFKSTDNLTFEAKLGFPLLNQHLMFHKPHAIIIFHNHLSNNPYPTRADYNVTGTINVFCKTLQIKLYDHIIYTEKNGCYSFKDTGKLEEIENHVDINANISRLLY